MVVIYGVVARNGAGQKCASSAPIYDTFVRKEAAAIGGNVDNNRQGTINSLLYSASLSCAYTSSTTRDRAYNDEYTTVIYPGLNQLDGGIHRYCGNLAEET